MPDYLLMMRMGNCSIGLEENVIAVMSYGFLTNLFTEFTVNVCNMFTQLKLR